MYHRNILILFLFFFSSHISAQNALVFQTDFGLEEPAVASMKGVAFSVSPQLNMFDITHEIPRFDIREAAYRLNQIVDYWPVGTVFVSVVDPGVGSERKSVVMKSKSGYYFVSPDNGSLGLVAESHGVEEVREINENTNRLPGSERSHTFHGRDVYAYTGARLASNQIDYEDVGKVLEPTVKKISNPNPDSVYKNNSVIGYVTVLDTHYGNVWTNISANLFDQLDVKYGDKLNVSIISNDGEHFDGLVAYARSFSGVSLGEALIYINDIENIGIAINQGSFAKSYKVTTKSNTRVVITKQSNYK